MRTEPRSVKNRAALAAEVPDKRFSLQEIALDDARNDIARLNEGLEGVKARIVKEIQRLEQEFRETAERQDAVIAALEEKQGIGKRRELTNRIREEMEAREVGLIGALQQDESLTKRILLKSAKAMTKMKEDLLIELRQTRQTEQKDTIDRFGDEDKLKKHYLAEVKAIGNTRMSETSALPQWQKLHDGLTNTVAALVSLGVNTKTDEAYLTPDLLASYPEALVSRWRDSTLLDHFHENEILVLQFVRVVRDFDEAQIFPGVTKKKFSKLKFCAGAFLQEEVW
ncbi:hypothetical protein OUZ56_012490 [Daphnia magna]|uniref:Mitofilin n=1 Tax=Daphnia magna TaxID=35525 RepID=A0ABQ9Z4D6_9CRUS|nr:hypothetical protein OUZ56_012490 [Daphnia magna]